MKTIKLLVFLCSVLGLVGVFSVARTAVAHNDATAMDVISGSATLEDFVKHALEHMKAAKTFEDITQLVTDFRNDDGDWKSGSTYLIILTSPGGGVQSHANNRGLEDEDWYMLEDSRGNPVGQMFLSVGTEGGPIDYYNQTEKQSYAVEFADPIVPILSWVLIGGFDYEPAVDQVPYAEIPYVDNIPSPTTEAKDVNTREELKMFVKDAIKFFQDTLISTRTNPNLDLAKARKFFRAVDGPWRHVSTYIYIMDNGGNVVFNGGNRNIEQTNLLQSQDSDLVEIINRLIATSEKQNEDERFVEYNWDNPAVDGDSAPGGGAGGSSPKLGYVETFTIPVVSQVLIFGSGLYLGSDTPGMDTPGMDTPGMDTPGMDTDDDGACAIAGDGNTTQSTIFNLFLVMSALFLAISFKRRSV